jgi:type IV pilus assembly protein PilA
MSNARGEQMNFKKSNAPGFSLIELLIVVAIILIIAAIAIPNLLRSKIAANQASAVESLRTVDTAEVTYSSTYNAGYSSTLAELGPPASGATASSTTADLIDSVLAGGTKSGYTIVYSPGATDGNGNYLAYTVNGNPVSVGQTGQDYYYSDASAVIRFNTSVTAGATDNPLQ